MKRAALLVALLALSNCATECGAVGHGSIGRGAVADGAVGGGAVGGRPVSSGIPNTIPEPESLLLHYAARLESGYSDGDTLTAATDFGTLGVDLSAAGTGADATFESPCPSGGLGGHPCFQFNAGKSLAGANYTEQSGVLTLAYVGSYDATASSSGVMIALGTAASTTPWLYQAFTTSRMLAGSGFAQRTVSPGELELGCIQWNTATSQLSWRLNAKTISTVNNAASNKTARGIYIGARENAASNHDGYVAEVMLYKSATVTCASIEEYLTRVYGPFPNGETDNITDGSKDGCADSLANADPNLCPSVGICKIGVIADSTSQTPADGSKWPTLLDEALDGCFDVINHGSSGFKVADCAGRWNDELEGREYDVVITHCGFNDMGVDADGATLAASLKTTLHDEVLADTSSTRGGGRVLSLGSMPFGLAAAWTSARQTEMDEFLTTLAGHDGITAEGLNYYAYMEDLADTNECPDGNGTSAEVWCYDGVHPSAEDSALYPGMGTTRMKNFALQFFDGTTPP